MTVIARHGLVLFALGAVMACVGCVSSVCTCPSMDCCVNGAAGAEGGTAGSAGAGGEAGTNGGAGTGGSGSTGGRDGTGGVGGHGGEGGPGGCAAVGGAGPMPEPCQCCPPCPGGNGAGGRGLTELWEILGALVLGTIAIIALFVRTIVAVGAARQNYYAHLSDVWYSLKDTEREHPEWLNPEVTTMYGLRERQLPYTPDAYDAHAWKSWALAEDWYVTFRRGIDPDDAEGCTRIKRRALRCLSKGSVLHQFEGALRSIIELHWAWLEVPRNTAQFEPEFLQWLARNYYYDRVEAVKGVALGRELRLKAGIDPVRAGQFLGGLRGELHPRSTPDTIQLGPTTHLLLEEPMRSLNHSNNPKAMVLGRSLVALENLEPSTPGKPTVITIDYNATEYLVSKPFSADGQTVGGWSQLDERERAAIRPRTHHWLRELQPTPPPK